MTLGIYDLSTFYMIWIVIVNKFNSGTEHRAGSLQI